MTNPHDVRTITDAVDVKTKTNPHIKSIPDVETDPHNLKNNPEVKTNPPKLPTLVPIHFSPRMDYYGKSSLQRRHSNPTYGISMETIIGISLNPN